jgi:hypothetical protein
VGTHVDGQQDVMCRTERRLVASKLVLPHQARLPPHLHARWLHALCLQVLCQLAGHAQRGKRAQVLLLRRALLLLLLLSLYGSMRLLQPCCGAWR